MKLAAIAKLIKADGYCKLYKVFYDDCRTYDLYIGTKTAIFPLTGFPKAQNESELATLLGISKKEWADKVSSFVHNDRIVKVTIDGKTYETSWANVVLVEE